MLNKSPKSNHNVDDVSYLSSKLNKSIKSNKEDVEVKRESGRGNMYHRNLTDARSKLDSSDEKAKASKSSRYHSRLKRSERSANQNLGKYIQNNENSGQSRKFQGSF